MALLRRKFQVNCCSLLCAAGSVYSLLKSYFLKFGDKQICFEDMSTYFDLLESDEAEKVSIRYRHTLYKFCLYDICGFS